MFKLDLEKAEEPVIKLPSSAGSQKREFLKNIYFCFIDYAKAFDCVGHNKLENPEREGNTRPADMPLEKPICRSGGLVILSLQNFPQFIVTHTVKGFGIVNKAEIDIFLVLSCFFHDPVDAGNLISRSSAFLISA